MLVTHNISLCLPSASHVVVLDNGRILDQGIPQELVDRDILGHDDEALKTAVSRSASVANSRAPSRVSSRVQISQIVEEQEGIAKVDAMETKKREDREAKANLVQEESRAQGSVEWKVYGSYMGSLGGYIFWALIATAFLCQQGLNILQTYWIREWALSYQVKTHFATVLSVYSGHSSSNAVPFSLPNTIRAVSGLVLQSSDVKDMATNLKRNSDLNYYLGVYAFIAFLFCVATFVRIVIVSFGSIRASRVLHEKLLETVLHSKIRFFDATPLGRIMNR